MKTQKLDSLEAILTTQILITRISLKIACTLVDISSQDMNFLARTEITDLVLIR